jgi:hypothetical protein
VGRERIIERERRWAVPAAVVALAPLVLYIVSIIVVGRAHLVGGSSEAEQLASLHDHAGTVLISSVVRGLGFLLLPIPFLYLFRAAQARNPRVQAAMVGFVFIGPILFGAQGIVQAVGAGQAATDFVNAPTETTRHYANYQKQVKDSPDQIEKVTIYTDAQKLEVQQADQIGGGFYQVDFPSKDESTIVGDLNAKGIDNETDSDTGTGPPDAEANKITSDNGTLQASQGLLFPAVLGLVVMMVYVSLQSLLAGLVTKFLGSLGMALGASMILILPIAVLGMLAWTGWLGLTFVGRVPGGRPPAWAAGKAIPWQRPGEPATTGDDAIEGDATEVDDESTDSDSQRKAPQKRKRKRRD